MLAEQGVEAVLRAIAAADRNWLTVLVETEVRLWHDPEFERRMMASVEQRGALLERGALLAELAGAQTEGRLRSDVDLVDLVDFAATVINGLALRVVGGDPLNINSFVSLVNDALRPRASALASNP